MLDYHDVDFTLVWSQYLYKYAIPLMNKINRKVAISYSINEIEGFSALNPNCN